MEENSDLKLKIQNLEEQLKKHESPTCNPVEEREAKNRLKAECDSLKLRNQNLVSACIKSSQNSDEVTDDRQQLPSPERLQKIGDRTLASLKLGKQAPGYKFSKKAIEKFIEELTTY